MSHTHYSKRTCPICARRISPNDDARRAHIGSRKCIDTANKRSATLPKKRSVQNITGHYRLTLEGMTT